MKIDLPLGDIADRITILRLKIEMIKDAEKVSRAQQELDGILAAWRDADLPNIDALSELAPIAETNRRLWNVEDALRECEKREDFGENFVLLARSVYQLNDTRARHKTHLNTVLGSELVEVKSYA